jgi:hypothetical protein
VVLVQDRLGESIGGASGVLDRQANLDKGDVTLHTIEDLASESNNALSNSLAHTSPVEEVLMVLLADTCVLSWWMDLSRLRISW